MNRNPLMRCSDRIEGLLRIAALIVAVAMIPFAAAAGTTEYTAAAHRIRAENSTKVAVQATVLADPVTVPGFGGTTDIRRAPVRWIRDGSSGQASVDVPRNTVRGNVIEVWIGPSGHPVPPPTPSDMAEFAGIGSAVVVLMVVWAGVAGVLGAAQWALNRRRSAAWAHEWRLMALSPGKDNR